jgi:hypothetical protein
MTASSRTQKKYSFLLSLAFIGIGGYKLYEKFYLGMDLENYQWILAAGLVALGTYQLVRFILKNRKQTPDQ